MKSPFEGDEQIHEEIRSSIEKLNNEISEDDSSYIHLIRLNKMFQFFESVYTKNLALFDLCKSMNDEIIENASKITKNLNESDQTQSTLKELNDKYQEVLYVATQRNNKYHKNKEKIQNLKEQINELRQKIKGNEDEILAETLKIVCDAKLEMEKNNSEKEELSLKLKETQENYNSTKNYIQNMRDEIKKSKAFIKELSEKEKLMKKSRKNEEKIAEEYQEKINSMGIDLQNDQLHEMNNKNLKEVLMELQNKVLILKEERAEHLKIKMRSDKTLKNIQQEINNRNKFISGITKEIDLREEQLASYYKSLTNLKEEKKEILPQYKEVLKKYNEVRIKKEEMQKQSKELQNDLFKMNHKCTKSENDKNQTNRTVQYENREELKLESFVQKEVKKTNEVAYQGKNITNEMLMAKGKLFVMGGQSKYISDETNAHIVQKKLSLANYVIENDIHRKNIIAIDELNEKILSIKKETEVKDNLCQDLKKEKSEIQKKIKKLAEENEVLLKDNENIIETIDKMTKNINAIVEKTIQEHFLCSECKSAMTYLNIMKDKVEEGVSITNKVIFDLKTEKQTLKKLIDQTILDRQAQLKDFETLKHSKDLIYNQIKLKEKEILEKQKEIELQSRFLENGHSDYDKIMKVFFERKNELEKHQNNTIYLQAKVEHCKDLILEKRRLEEHLTIQKCQTTALYEESRIKVHIHRWHDLYAFNPEYLKQIKFFHRLKNLVLEKSNEYKRLETERDELKEKLNNINNIQTRQVIANIHDKDLLAKYQEKMEIQENEDDGFFFITKPDKVQTMCDVIQEEIQRTKQELSEKTKMINKLEKIFRDKAKEIDESRKSINSARRSVNMRRSVAYQIKMQNAEFEKKSNKNIISEPNEKFSCANRVMGGGFKPKPPNNPKNNNVPRLDFRKINKRNNSFSEDEYDNENEVNFAPRPPVNNPQRTRRTDIRTLRKNLSLAMPESARRKKNKKMSKKKKKLSNFA